MKLTKNERKMMLGLLPFDGETIDKFTPKQYKSIPEKYKPVFHLKPWNQKEKDEITLIISKLEVAKDNAKEKVDITKELNESTRKKICNIENLFDVGLEKIIDCPMDKDGYVSDEMWSRMPEVIKTALYFQLSIISGITTAEQLGL